MQTPKKKITAKTLGFTIPIIRKMLSDNKGKEVSLYQLIGMVKNTRTGTSDFGPWTAFKGIVEAIVFETGEAFLSGECLIPGGVTDVLEAHLIAAKKEDPNAQIQFGFEISVIETETAIGFEYVVRSLLEKDEAAVDPLAALKENLLPTNGKVKKLAKA